MAGNVREVNDPSFEIEVINSDKPVLVEFWATWCGPCKIIAPHVQALADEFAGRAVVAKVDVDANKQWAIKYGIQSIPTLLFFKGASWSTAWSAPSTRRCSTTSSARCSDGRVRMSGAEERTAAGPRGTVAYQLWPGDGPAVVLLAGLGSTARLWGELPRALTPSFTVLAPDNRGVGGSGDGEPFTLADPVPRQEPIADAAALATLPGSKVHGDATLGKALRRWSGSVSGCETKVAKNDATNSITVISTLDEMALADRFIRSNDKPKGEILVEVEIMEVNRTKAKEYGLQLSNYQAGVELRPTGAEGEVSGGLTNLRAIFLSSLNASGWVVQIPSAIFAKFLQDDSMGKILSSPKVRAFESRAACSSDSRNQVEPIGGGQIGLVLKLICLTLLMALHVITPLVVPAPTKLRMTGRITGAAETRSTR